MPVPKCAGATLPSICDAMGSHQYLPEMGMGLLQSVGCCVPFWAFNAELHGFGTIPVFTNTQDAGKYLESYGAVEGVFICLWSQSASLLGCLT